MILLGGWLRNQLVSTLPRAWAGYRAEDDLRNRA